MVFSVTGQETEFAGDENSRFSHENSAPAPKEDASHFNFKAFPRGDALFALANTGVSVYRAVNCLPFKKERWYSILSISQIIQL